MEDRRPAQSRRSHQKERETQATYSHLFNNMPILYMQERAVFDAQGTAIDTVYVDVTPISNILSTARTM